MGRLTDRLIQRVTLRRWRRRAQVAERTGLPDLRRQRGQARALRQQLDRLIRVADERLALPATGTEHFAPPHGTDWSWRPELWRRPLPRPGVAPVRNKTRFGDRATLFHDCPLSDLTLRQQRNLRKSDLAPCGLRLDVLDFRGTFLSLAIDLPPAAARNLSRTHLIRLNAVIETETPLKIFARLNVRHGPNTEQTVRELPLDGSHTQVEFDLAYGKLNERRIEKLWLDLIFARPEMNRVVLRDLTLARYRRAAI